MYDYKLVRAVKPTELKDAASSTEGIIRSDSRMKTLPLTVSFFAWRSFCPIVLLFCLHVCLLSYFEITRCIVKSLTATSTYFLRLIVTSTEKRKLDGCFLGTSVLAPKPVYSFSKWTEYVTVG